MPSLKSLKQRIRSIKSTQKITKAMKMVAVSKLKKARAKSQAASEYAERLENVIHSLAPVILPNPGTIFDILFPKENEKVHLLVCISSDRGLCGAFNQNLVKLVKSSIRKLESEGKRVKLLCIGKKANDLLKIQHKEKIIKSFDGLTRKGVNYDDAVKIGEFITDEFIKGSFDSCALVFNKFNSAISQVPVSKQIIPLQYHQSVCDSYSTSDFEPSEEKIVETLLPKHLCIEVFNSMLESSASEHGARMTAMD
ncbi:MAG: ATP synthase F1 subunit gamma, partial [Alphaproteobacteria bacterium]